MSHAGQLPLYAFCLPGAGREIFAFVYRLGTWRALIGDGSILEAATLPILRERLAAAWGESPKALGVLRLSERLAWVPPVAPFQDLEARRWLPLFEAEGGLIGPWDLTKQPFPAPEEGLLAVLVGRIPEGGVFQGLDPTWTLRLAAGLIPAGESLRCFSRDGGRLVPRDLPVFRDPGGSAWIAWATAGGAEAAALLAPDREGLRHLVGCYLTMKGILSHPEAIRWVRQEREPAGLAMSTGFTARPLGTAAR